MKTGISAARNRSSWPQIARGERTAMKPARFARTAFLVLAMASVLSACGRKADLDPPGAPQQPGTSTEEAAPETRDRPFILDGLLE